MNSIYNKIRLTLTSENSLNLLLNHLAVVYAFFLPINYEGYARSFIFSLMVIFIIIRKNYKYYFIKSFKNPIAISFLAYTLIYYIWLIGADDTKHAYYILHYIKVALYPILFYTFLDAKFTKKIITALILGVMVSELLSYLIFFKTIPLTYYISNINFPWKHHLSTITFYEAKSILDPIPFMSHEIYTPLLALIVTILIYNFITYKSTIKFKFISIFFILTMTTNIFITGGRMGYLIFFILISSMLFISSIKITKNKLLFLFLFLFSVFTVAYNYSTTFKGRVQYTIKSSKEINTNHLNFSSSAGTRLGLWYYSIDKIKERPFFGYGTGDQMLILKSNIKDKDKHLKKMPTMHNQYFELLLQFGFIGLIVYLNLLFQIFRYNTISKEYNDIKLYILIMIFMVSLTSPLYYFFIAFLSFTIPVITAENNIIKDKIKPLNAKTIFYYLLFIIFCYIYQEIQ